jgi:hypothetical protein
MQNHIGSKLNHKKHITLFLLKYRNLCKHIIHVFGYCDKQHSEMVWYVDNLAWGDLIAPISGEIFGAESVKILAFPSQSVQMSDQGDFRAYSVEILMFASPTDYMLTSFGFLLLN